MSMIMKIGEWVVKWHLKVIIDAWVVLNDKWVESWEWCGESPGWEGKVVRTKISKIKLTISKYSSQKC